MFLSRFVTQQDFPLLLKYLIQIQLNQFHLTTSVFAITGDHKSGKNTIINIIKKLNKNYIISCVYTPVDLKQEINTIHHYVNHYNHSDLFITGFRVTSSDYSECDENDVKLKKNLIILNLPYKIHYIDDYHYYIDKTVNDIKVISQQLQLYHVWFKFKNLMKHYHLYDIDKHYAYLIINFWLQIIPSYCLLTLWSII